MPSKYQIVSELAARTAQEISSNAGRYMDFLTTAANNYKYTFKEQLLIHAQRPIATACAEIDTWNRLGRWVNKGTKGIALLVDNRDAKYKLRYVFDVTDTNSRAGYVVSVWRMEQRDQGAVVEDLSNTFGELEPDRSFAESLIRSARMVVEDNLADYLSDLNRVKEGSFLEELDDLNTEVWLRETMAAGVGFMLLTRCGIDARDYFFPDDFRNLHDFNTPEVISILGAGTSDVAEMVLREIESTVKALRREEKNQNRTFANPDRERDNVRETTERSDEHGTDLSTGGRLSAAQPRSAREPEDREVWDASARLPAEAPRRDLYWDASARNPQPAPGRDRPAGDRDGGDSHEPDGTAGRRGRAPESLAADAVGAADEQHPGESRGDRAERPDLRLSDEPAEESAEEVAVLQPSGHDFNAPSDIPYFHYSSEKQELLRISDALKDHRVTIAAYFADHEDSKERGNFIKGCFDNTYVEKILSSGQRVGYRAYDDVLTMWRGAYLSREMEVFMRWESVAASIYGMILMEQWLDPDERTLPSEGEQMALIEAAQAEKDNAFTLPQAAIDYVLAGGSGVSQGKFRIYEQFQKGESAEDNVKFLKNEYGIGGHSDAIPGTGIWEDHDSKGITLKDGDQSVTLKWPKVEKRIRELIAADRYLNSAEQAAYPNYLHGQEVRRERSRIAGEFKEIVDGFKDYLRDMGAEDTLPDRWYLTSCATAFSIGEKKTIARDASGDFVLPMMRETMQVIIDEGVSPFIDRAEAVMDELSGPLAFGLEPTDEELNPPPPPKKEYRIKAGDAVWIGAQEFEVVFLGSEKAVLSDAKFPMMQDEYSRADFDRMVSENPMNDRFLLSIEDPEQQYDLGFGHLGNGLTVWNRLEIEHGDYKTIAHIAEDRSVTFYDAGLPDAIKAQILETARTSEMTVSATQDTPVFTTPAQKPEQQKPGNDLWQDYSLVREAHGGAIVFYQVGDFYEVLGEDARIVAAALDIGLTTRNVGLPERVPMCGIPVNSNETFITLLHDRGYDLAVVDDAGQVYPLPADHAQAPVESRPIGRIDYLAHNGYPAYSVEYTDVKRFLPDILDENHYGVPMSIVVYRDKDGNSISTDFVKQLDPPPQSFEIVDYEQVRPETSLAHAKRLINEYSLREFESEADFTDLEKVGLAYTETEDEGIPVEAEADLINCRINRYVNGRLVDRIEYDSLEDMIHAELEYMDFNELVSFNDEQIEMGMQETEPEPEQPVTPKSRVDEMLRQARLAAELSRQTGQDVFAFEEGNPLPENIPPQDQKPAETETVLSPPAARPRSKVTPTLLYPEIPSMRRFDFHIENDDLGVGAPLDRFYRNIRAIQLLKKLEDEHRLALPTEQGFLAEYGGWGGLPQFFEEGNAHYGELKAVLTDEEYASARESSLTAFYTPPVVIRAMYQALENMGFKRGNLLEPSCGVGNFLGMKPESLSDSRIYGIELDSISGRIAQQLYQTSSIAVQGFEKTELPDSFFDVAIGNVPFGDFKLPDKKYDKYNFLIHDYFFAKTLDKVRPGGIIAFVTSKGTMDKTNPNVRKYIAQRADLLGAIRLPNDTFKGAAGTEVTSDILFFQKRDTLTVVDPGWVHLATDENGITMNQYFVNNPEMVLGEMKEVSGPFGPETACIAYEDQELGELLTQAIQNITGSIQEYDVDELADEEEDKSIPADPSVRNFSYTLVDGELYYRENSRMTPVDVSVTGANRIKGLIAIRDSVRQLIEYQTEDYPDTMIAAEQEKLNQLYDDFTAKYGIINSRANKSVFSADNAFFLLSSLEVLDDEGIFIGKADMFSKRTIKQRTVITHVDTATEALAVSISEKARVDMPYMMELTGKDEPELYDDLKGVIFLNPMYGYGNDSAAKYLPADEYLSGNVREKLQWARRSAELNPEDFTPNVEALERVQPVDLTAAEISVRIGATWIPPEDYEQFMFELFDTPWWATRNIKIHYSQFTGEWNIEGKTYDRGNVRSNSTYGTDRINGYKIMEQTLNLKDVRIFDYIEDAEGKKKPVLNKKETAIAQGKQELIKQAFADWVWKDPARRERLTKLYNEKFNSTRPREFDGSHLALVGINPEITLRQHQLNAVARGLYGGNELLGHVVGAGKTYTMVAIAQEAKRLGLCQKSLIVVPNHLTEQWGAEYLQLYPSANIIVATAKDFETRNRKRFCARIATGDYDAVIIGHSQLEKIPLSIERQAYYLEQQLDEIMEGIAELKENRGDKFSIKQMERAKKQVQAKLDRLNDQSRKDDVVTFEELGIDKLFIDEAHYYKNLAAFTKMRNVGGISQTEAQKSSDLYMKIRYLDELTGGRGVCFATGTPISNTMVEMYTMQKYLQYDTLHRNGLIHFDSWASTFGETVTAIELAPEGTGYRAKTRFAKFYNLPELMAMFKECADIQTADMLNLPVPKANYHNVVLKPSELQKEMVADLAKRAERVRSGMVNSSEDNMLVITNDGRKLALDQRLMNEMLPESETGKVAACAQNVFEIWQRTIPQRSTQMIFCDLSTPHGDGHFNVYDAIRDKLIEKGIPAEEIAYIHSAGTEVKKKELFGKVRSGQIRVLIGSTQKMGAGTNVQKKLIALHHCDCPWRPADLQQREGRIIRQGNETPAAEIYTYVTENTFDSYLYQLVESKQKFIGQIMTSKSPVRSAEDIDETALSYAEIKALCSGNPEIKEKMDLDVAVAKLKLLKANHLSQKYALEDRIIKDFPKQISTLEQRIEGFKADMDRLKENTLPNEDGFSPMVIEGQTYTEKKAAGSAILEACHNMASPDAIPLGQYRGFELELYFETFSKEYRLTMKGALSHTVSLGTDVFGNVQRMDNMLGSFEDLMHNAEAQLQNVRVQLENAKHDVELPFPQEEELRTKSARLDELNISLNMDRPENEILDSDREEDEPDGRSTKALER